ncbi:MAG: metal-dependent hydrolase [Candidatus Omnitrophica bacterium CG11_big_fil_rev_8_21_14_0_20_43_6]|nr:MAG: metal-dependent hydrolase [Candidatus Omnitrophica bacterium CG11_big_fil_rev_8_21_14_0_20_43_6]
MKVKIIRSKRRRRSVGARLVDDLLLINAPLLISQDRLDEMINDFKLKFTGEKIKTRLDKEKNLLALANLLNKEYFDNQLKIKSIEYTTNQNTRFGCCNYRTAEILISHRIGLMPKWVRKYVLLHEMAHLIQPNHSRAFWEMVYRYRLTERTRGYLMGASTGMKEGG